MKRPRILMIAPLPPPVHGSSMMTQYIKESEFINELIHMDWINLSTSRRMDEIGKKSFMKFWRFILAYIKTLWSLLTHRYEACYIALTCHGNGFLKDAPFALLCKLFGCKLIIHQHNKGMSDDLKSHWRVKLLKAVYKNSSVILLSWKLYPDIKAIVRREQIKICPNGIPDNSSLSVPKISTNPISNILFLSNLIPSKGVYILLDALKILKDKGYQFICNFVGGESTEISADIFTQAVSDRDLNKYVKYLGKKYGTEKNEIFANNDIFVFPTFYNNECFPLVLLEAMQAGLPCISTDEGAIPDLLDNTGIIVKTRNSEQVADAIEKLINDKELYSVLSQNAQQRFKENYTISSFEQNILAILNSEAI